MPATVRTRLPALLGLALALEFWVELAFAVPAGTPHRGLVALLLGAIAAAIAFGPRAPLAGVLVVSGSLALIPALSETYYHELLLPFAATFLAAYWLGRYASRARLAVGLVLATPLGLAATGPYHDDGVMGGVLEVAVALGGPALIGRLLRSHAALRRALRERAALLERRREDAAGRAVVDERTRIAGELHDVVAHALSAMTVQATGARRLALTRPELAREAFGAIESAGREALDELRRLLGVLRREDAELTLAPQPSLRHVGSLVRGTTAAGLLVTLRVEGAERELAAGLDVSACRVLQEALAAALEFGGAGCADVRLRFGAEALEIDVRDDGPLLSARPLSGVRERVLLHGGRMTAGRHRSGGHAVRATLPLDGQAMAPEEPAEAPCELAEEQQLAATEERRRIARELHDLVAHSMSVMVVQAGGARRILDRDPGRALEAATRIERTGREALGEMRHLLGVLNGDDHPAALAPQPTLAEIGELIARARSAGLPTVLEFRGERRALPAGLDLVAYRIVQEGLTNTLKHAGRAPTTVTVDWSQGTLRLEVRNHGARVSHDAGGGHGLVGMRERVRLYGGELEAGPADGGGWRVRATLPLGVRELSAA